MVEKFNYINNSINCDLIRKSDQKTEIVRFDKKQDQPICFPQETQFRFKDRNRLRDQKGNKRLGQHYKAHRPDQHLENIPTKNNRMQLFSREHSIFSSREYSKRIFNTFKRIKIIQNMVYDYSGMKLEICNRKKCWKFTNILEIKQQF